MRASLVSMALVLTVAACTTGGAEPGPVAAAPSEPGPEDNDPADGEVDEPPRPDQDDQVLAPAREITIPMRAVWVHLFDDTLKSRASIERLVAELEAADATAVIAQVARRHDAYYGSQVLPATADPNLEPGLDVIDTLTELAHDADIEVHAWISVAPTWHAVYDDLDAPAAWVPTEHGRDAPVDQRWVSRTADGTWTEYLDPALPQVREHVARIISELTEDTPVDGVHLDYVRYESDRSGYHPAVLDRYRDETGATGTPAIDDPDWSAWRREQSQALIARAREALDAADRQITLSAATITWGEGPRQAGGFRATRTTTDALQDWPAWVEAGLLDAVMPMNYFRDHDEEQAGWFDDWLAFEAELAATADTLVVPGIGGWLNQPVAVLGQVGAATLATDGAVVYSYQQPTDDSDLAGEVDGIRPFWRGLAEQAWGHPADR